MSELSTSAMTEPAAGATDADIAALPPARPWMNQVWRYTVVQTGARVGLVWIAIVAFCAVFAPLLANSFPLLVKMNGKWSSPAWQHMTPSDVTLLLVTAVALVLWPIPRLGFGRKLVICSAAAVVFGVGSLLLIHPPQAEVFEEFRVLQKEGKIERAIYAPVAYSANDRLRDDFQPDNPHPRPPSEGHRAGTNPNGADVLSHLIHACRIAMAVGFISTGISMVIGVIIGSLMGYYAGWVDLLGMRLVEIFGSLPTIYLLLTFVAAFPDYRSIYLIMAIIGIVSWTGDARFVRAEFLKLRHQDFVQAAIAAGLPLRSVLFRHILPNALAPLLVSASFGIAGAIIYESTLSFLGLGIPLGDASWGQLLTDAVGFGGSFKWWLAMYPGFAIFLTVLAYNLIGEAIRDALDPKLRKRE
jgi:peptide/nickel transport system permease protein